MGPGDAVNRAIADKQHGQQDTGQYGVQNPPGPLIHVAEGKEDG